MFLKDLHKQDKLKVVVDDTKQLMKFCIDKEEGNNSWDITELSNEDIIRLYRWYDLYQFNEPLDKEN